ncbi:MAG: hypothetical protein CM1200mP39_20040 [Dehalococcoidia bacterium]|nr:MAG: hypothetical protein CM1200mP39_20040 [Dehalococcoidia bacterium]
MCMWIHPGPTNGYGGCREKITVKSLLRKYLETVGHERIIFGSDSSWFPRGFSVRYFEDQVRDLRELNASNDQMEAIFNGNARKNAQALIHHRESGFYPLFITFCLIYKIR